MTRDAAPILKKVSALRALCLKLPHLPTLAETGRLRRFEAVARAPESAAPADVEAVAAGWRMWWREGRTDELLRMAARLPPGFAEADRRLACYALAAGRRSSPLT